VDDTVRVVYLSNTDALQGIQEMLTQLRTVVNVMKVYNASGPRAIVFRGNSATIATGDWLIAQLDKPIEKSTPPANYVMSGAADGEFVRVYYLHNIDQRSSMQQLLAAVRLETKITHAFTSQTRAAMAIRGTNEQIAATDALVAKYDVR
jgi:hypothetical protein